MTGSGSPERPDARLMDAVTEEGLRLLERLGRAPPSVDGYFVAYLRRVARFGFVAVGPVTIDVRLVEDLLERLPPEEPAAASERLVRFSRLLMAEVRKSGQSRIDELHLLLAFMRLGDGLPGRVFGELGVTPDQVAAYVRETRGGSAEPPERLLTPEQVAEYLQVHVHTVRGWIRAGRLPARRIAGLRALRVRYADVISLLKPVDTAEPEED
jgi:excisionase family DNA binding protein